jgi:hypothetical protein
MVIKIFVEIYCIIKLTLRIKNEEIEMKINGATVTFFFIALHYVWFNIFMCAKLTKIVR